MLETDKAVDIVLQNLKPIGSERISIFEALGRIIASPVTARRDLPPMDNSAMDGYAIIASDTENSPCKLKVKGVIAAGDDARKLTIEKGACYRIMTGAFMPAGADSVIQHEMTDNGHEIVTIDKPVKKGFCVRHKSEDMASGNVIDRVGEVVTPYHIARFVSAGVFYISVYRKPKVAVISTGNEIADPAEQDDAFKIFDSNGPMTKALLEEWGAEASYLGVVPDSEEELFKLFSSLKGFDLIVTSAGISVGDFDFMNIVADKLGIKWEFDAINQKPGMHMSFGFMGGVPVFACPGNPVSAMFCSFFYIKPAVLKLSGSAKYRNEPVVSKLGVSVMKKKGRVQFDRVSIVIENGSLVAYPFESQDSHRIESLVSANAFAKFDNDMVGEIPKGCEVKTYVFNSKQVLG